MGFEPNHLVRWLSCSGGRCGGPNVDGVIAINGASRGALLVRLQRNSIQIVRKTPHRAALFQVRRNGASRRALRVSFQEIRYKSNAETACRDALFLSGFIEIHYDLNAETARHDMLFLPCFDKFITNCTQQRRVATCSLLDSS